VSDEFHRYSVDVHAKRRAAARILYPNAQVWYYATGRRATCTDTFAGRYATEREQTVHEYVRDLSPGSRDDLPETVWARVDRTILEDFEVEESE
jgi:hypothetical protein